MLIDITMLAPANTGGLCVCLFEVLWFYVPVNSYGQLT